MYTVLGVWYERRKISVLFRCTKNEWQSLPTQFDQNLKTEHIILCIYQIPSVYIILLV